MGLREQANESSAILRGVDAAAARAASPTVTGDELMAMRREQETAVETDPAIPADLDVPANVAWSRVMGEVTYIRKSRAVTSGPARYNFRGIDDVMDAVGPALRKHGVIVMPTAVDASFEVIGTTCGKAMNYCRNVMAFTVIGPRGDVLPVEGAALGEAFDSGDKSGTKASSVALRTFFIQALAIPVNAPALDPEHGEQHEIAGPRRPTADEYAAEIVAKTTSLDRLRSIQAELKADRRMAETEVEVLGREGRVSLLALVGEVGRERAARGEG